MKFRKKPVVIDAEQWYPGIVITGVEWPTEPHRNLDSSKGWIKTLEGGYVVSAGDWIVTGVHGEKYPVKPEIFALTYETV